MKASRILLCVVFFFSALIANAQEIKINACLDQATSDLLGENNALALVNKMSTMITRNGMSDAPGLFLLLGSLVITDEGRVQTGMTNVYVLRADLTLSVMKTADQSIMANKTISLEASGNSYDVCLRSLISKINVSNVHIAKMLVDIKPKLAEYYQ